MFLIDKTITSFLEDLENNKKRSWRTVRNYDLYLRRLSGWLAKNKIFAPNQITKGMICQYQSWLASARDPIRKKIYKKNTQNYHLIAGRAFLRFLAKKKVESLPAAEIKLARLPKAKIDFLEKRDLEKLLDAPTKIKQDKTIQARDKAILELLYCSGLKVSEIAELKTKEIDFKKGAFETKKQIMPISNQCQFWLNQYRALRHTGNEYFFIGHDRAKNTREKQKVCGLTPRSIERIVNRYAKFAGIDCQATPNILRHTFARNLLLAGNSLANLQKRLGHVSISTTKRYLE